MITSSLTASPDELTGAEALDAFYRSLNAVTRVPDRQIKAVSPLLKVRALARRELFVSQGQRPDSFAFVYSGLFRYFYSDPEGKEFTKGFFPEATYIASYSALIQRRESYFSIQALEDAIIVEIDFSKWQSLAANEPCWQKFLINLLEMGYCVKESREREFLLFDAEQRYQSFLNTYPGMEKRIRQHVIASYLGITPVALSRLRKRGNRKKH